MCARAHTSAPPPHIGGQVCETHTSLWPEHFHFLAQEHLREAAEAACSGTVLPRHYHVTTLHNHPLTKVRHRQLGVRVRVTVETHT